LNVIHFAIMFLLLSSNVMRFIAICLIIALASSLCILSRRREEKRKGKRVTDYELPSITSLEDDGFGAQTTASPSHSSLLVVITVRRFTAGRLFYSRILEGSEAIPTRSFPESRVTPTFRSAICST